MIGIVGYRLQWVITYEYLNSGLPRMISGLPRICSPKFRTFQIFVARTNNCSTRIGSIYQRPVKNQTV